MKTLLVQPRNFFGRSNVLRGGGAPVHWKSELARQVDRVGEVFRRCGWLAEIAEARPSFFDEPLFGACLAEIMGSESRQPAEALDIAARFNPPPIKTADSTFKPAPNNSQLSEHTRGAVFQLPSYASASLLEQLAASLADVRQVEHESSPRVSSFPRRVGSSSPSSIPQVQNRDYRELVAIRTGRRLKSWPAPLAAVTLPIPEASLASPAQGFAEEFGEPLSLEDQWTTSLEGQKAPPEILDHLARGVRRDPGTPARARHSIGAAQLPDNRGRRPLENKRPKPGPIARSNSISYSDSSAFADQSAWWTNPSWSHKGEAPPRWSNEREAPASWSHEREAPARWSNEREAHPRWPNERQAPASWSNDTRDTHWETFPGRDHQWMAHEDHASSFVHPAQSRTGDESGLVPASGFAPPALTATLPPLVPPSSPGSHVLPLAAETARHGAWRNEISEEEKDLGFLAAQIKRILDEEARRHGIDV